MYKIIVKSFDFLNKFANIELTNLTKQDWTQIDTETYELIVENKEEVVKHTYELVYYSRCFDGIYLDSDKQTDAQDFSVLEKVEIDYNKKPKQVYDLIGDILETRMYKINEDDNYLSHFLVTYCCYKLELQNEPKLFSVIDPLAELGDIIIETSLFHPRKPLYVKEKNKLPIYREFKIMPFMPKALKDKNKYNALVMEDPQFKKLRENVNEAAQKVKISKYEMEWLDVKFKKDELDYSICFIPEFDEEDCPGEANEFLKEYLYQTEFICKKKICLIASEEIPFTYVDKYELKCIDKSTITVDEEEFFVYIFEPTPDKDKIKKIEKPKN
ncbi:MAG: hypothetical protein HRU03_04885 [Nanoarchaeales archaeon]|nr:hypothetical protein [Nanoarchaeales archaeon]